MFYFEIWMESYWYESVCEGRMTSISLMSNAGLPKCFSGGGEHSSHEAHFRTSRNNDSLISIVHIRHDSTIVNNDDKIIIISNIIIVTANIC